MVVTLNNFQWCLSRKAVISQPDDGALLVLIVAIMNIADSVL